MAADEGRGTVARLAARRATARGVYGTVVVASVLAATGIDGATEAPIEITLAVSLVLFWLAHVYSAMLALAVSRHEAPGRAEFRRVLLDELPIVEAGVVPMVALAIAHGAGAGVQRAIVVALSCAVMELFVFGVAAARRAGLHGMAFALYTGSCTSLGLVIVVLEVLVRH